MLLVGASLLSAVLAIATTVYVEATVVEVRSHVVEGSAMKTLGSAKAFRRFVQDHQAALRGAVAAGPVTVGKDQLAPMYLAPGWTNRLASGHLLMFSVVAATDGEPVGYVYTIAAAGADAPVDLRAAIAVHLPEAARLDDHAAQFRAAVAAGLPAPADDGLILSTSQVRSAAALAGAVLRYREPGAGVQVLGGPVDLGGHQARGIGALAAGDIQASDIFEAGNIVARASVRAGSWEGPIR